MYTILCLEYSYCLFNATHFTCSLFLLWIGIDDCLVILDIPSLPLKVLDTRPPPPLLFDSVHFVVGCVKGKRSLELQRGGKVGLGTVLAVDERGTEGWKLDGNKFILIVVKALWSATFPNMKR
jgi:hypothetical protein